MHEISKHISYREATHSATAVAKGIKNVPTSAHLLNMMKLAEHVFEPLRAHAGGPIRITSFYRSPALNKAIGGSTTSQHCTGEAMDLDNDGLLDRATNAELFHLIRTRLQFDQLIWEHGTDTAPDWVHVSLKAHGPNRMQVLRARRVKGKTVYTPWKP